MCQAMCLYRPNSRVRIQAHAYLCGIQKLTEPQVRNEGPAEDTFADSSVWPAWERGEKPTASGALNPAATPAAHPADMKTCCTSARARVSWSRSCRRSALKPSPRTLRMFAAAGNKRNLLTTTIVRCQKGRQQRWAPESGILMIEMCPLTSSARASSQPGTNIHDMHKRNMVVP
jgi:hypothetical protein